MKKCFSLILALLITIAAAPVMADGIELDEIYAVYGLGEEIYIRADTTPDVEAALISIYSPSGKAAYVSTVYASELQSGVYISVGRTWELGEYTLNVTAAPSYIVSFVFTVVAEKVDRDPSTGGNASVNRNPITATDITISQTELTLELGKTATVTASGERSSYKWITDDNDKITINKANTAVAEFVPIKTGTATVWVYCGNNYATLRITIVPAGNGGSSQTAGQTNDLFTDLASVPWARDSINALAAAGIVNGIGNGIFASSQDVTRAQFVQMIVKAFNFSPVGNPEFTDINGSEWYADAVRIAAGNGIVNGYDGRFEPEASITCQDAALIVRRVLDMKKISLPAPALTETEGADYAREAIGLLRANGIIFNDMKFSPYKNATRAQSACLIYGAYKR